VDSSPHSAETAQKPGLIVTQSDAKPPADKLCPLILRGRPLSAYRTITRVREIVVNIILTKDAPNRKAASFLKLPNPNDITLQKGIQVNIALDRIVPVNQTIPCNLTLPVKLRVPAGFPPDKTEFPGSFVELSDVPAPHNKILDLLPDSWSEAICQSEAGLRNQVLMMWSPCR
jgi:hypothetical protein